MLCACCEKPIKRGTYCIKCERLIKLGLRKPQAARR